MRRFSTLALMVLSIAVCAVYLPLLYEKICFKRIGKTHLLFSPVTERFIYSEKIVGPIPPEAAEKAVDHHIEIAYRDEDGRYYTRGEFERALPFIYYKNMALWGLLPIRLQGRVFDKSDIRNDRQVLELKPAAINGHRPITALWPLIESNPGQVRLVFPEDRFRMTADAMEFINVDTNTVDAVLTRQFTAALTEKGFRFPARSVNGKFTILKPFNAGAFIVDAGYRVFHVKRVNGRPQVIRTPIDPALKTRHIKISENRRRAFYGLLLAENSNLYLLTCDNYTLIPLPLDSYDPDRMDFKLIINPLYRTAVISDDRVIRAVAMTPEYQPVRRFAHTMSRAAVTPAQSVYRALFPFRIVLDASDGTFMDVTVRWGGAVSLVGILCCLCCYLLVFRLRYKRLPGMGRVLVISLTGVYGLLVVGCISAGSEAS